MPKKSSPNFIDHLAGLIAHAKDLHYLDRHGVRVAVKVQPLSKLDRLNADPANARKLAECGVSNAVVIGSDELGTPILLDCASLKTYLLPLDSSGADYRKHEVAIRSE